MAIATGGSVFLQIFFGESRTTVQIPAHLPDRRSGAVCADFGWVSVFFPDGIMRLSGLLVCNYYHYAFLKFYDIV